MSTYLSLHVHIVFSKKEGADDRVGMASSLNGYLAGTATGLGGSVIAVGGVSELLRLLEENAVAYDPQYFE